LRGEEAECVKACEQVATEEKAILENPNGSEKQGIEKLLRVRATRDLRNTKLSNARKRLAQHADLLRFDLCEPLRRNMVNLAFGLLAHRPAANTETLSSTPRQRCRSRFAGSLSRISPSAASRFSICRCSATWFAMPPKIPKRISPNCEANCRVGGSTNCVRLSLRSNPFKLKTPANHLNHFPRTSL